MDEFPGYWLEVDAGSRACTVHAEGCPLTEGADDGYRGAERCRTEGGWLWFGTGAEVARFHGSELAPRGFAPVRDCDRCGGAAA